MIGLMYAYVHTKFDYFLDFVWICDCLSENQPSSHLRFYQVNYKASQKLLGMSQGANIFSSDQAMLDLQTL